MHLIDKIYEETKQHDLKKLDYLGAVWDALLKRSDIKEILRNHEEKLKDLYNELFEDDIKYDTLKIRNNIEAAINILSGKKIPPTEYLNKLKRKVTESIETTDTLNGEEISHTKSVQTTETQVQQPTTPVNDNMKILLDKFIPSSADKSHVARISAPNKIDLKHLRDDVLTKIFNAPEIKTQIDKATPEQLEQFANGVLIFFAKVIDSNQPKGGKFISNKGLLSNPIQWIADLFVSLWAAIKSGNTNPLRSFVSNKAHGIILNISEFENFASNATTGKLNGISAEQNKQAKENFEAIFGLSKNTQTSI